MNNIFNDIQVDVESLLFVGLGNRIKSDDGVGIYIAEKLKSKGLQNIIIAENSIENYFGRINRARVKDLIFIDAVDFGEPPAFCKILPVAQMVDTTTNTHNLSLKTISSFIDIPNQYVLGIQPDNVSYGFEISGNIQNIADLLIVFIIEATINKPKKIKI